MKYFKKLNFKFLLLSSFLILMIPISSHEVIGTEHTPNPLQAAGLQVLVSQANIFQAEQRFKMTRFGNQGHLALLEYNIAYGITQRLGIETTIDILLSGKVDQFRNKGLYDVPIFLTYNFYLAPTIIANISLGLTIPAGTPDKIPHTGTKSVNPYMAFTFVHNSDWFFLIDIDAFVTTRKKKNNIKLGSASEIELDFGRFFQLKSIKNTKILLGLSAQGFFQKRTKINGISDPNSGRHTIFLGPFISLPQTNSVAEWRIQLPIARVVGGKGPKADFRTEFAIQGHIIF